MSDEAIRTRHASGSAGGASAGLAPAPRSRRHVFTHREESVGEARRFADETLAGWGVTGRLDDVRLCLSEVATNALLHVAFPGAEPAGFTVALVRDTTGILLEVRDRGSGRPARRSPDAQDTTGRGLLLVGALSDGWGVRNEPDGKTVWLRFELDDDGTPG